MISYALKEANVNSTPAYSSKKVRDFISIHNDINIRWIFKLQEELAGLCPSGMLCAELSGECLKCNLNYSCVYGAIYTANCSVLEHVDCIVCMIYQS